MAGRGINKVFLRPGSRKNVTNIKRCAVCLKYLRRNNKNMLCCNHFLDERELNDKYQNISRNSISVQERKNAI